MSRSVAKPIIKQIKDSRDALDFFETVSLPEEDEKTQEIIKNFPTVYVHNWQESGDFEVYVGESNDIFKRTRQHYDVASDKSRWQSKLVEKDASLFIIGHEHFNKSLTLDIENRLMHYMMSVERVKHVHNLRDNPQTSYYPMEELDEIFRKIWRGLRKENKELFPKESAIKDSAIYKASPLHKLTKEQEQAREELDTKISVGKLIDTIEYDYPEFHLSMDCFWCEVVNGNLVLKEHEDARWLAKEQLDDVEWLPADITLIEEIRKAM